MDYQGIKALVFGLGLSGKSAVQFLLKKKASVVGVDKKCSFDLNIPHYSDQAHIDLRNFDMIVKSPGISWEHPLLVDAKKQNKKITSDIELGLQELQGKGKTLFAITGSNGKTTTTLLTAHILSQAKKKVISCGNVGTPFLTQIEQDADIFVLELSSYQLELINTPLFDAGVILNITPNHLERYASFDSYARTKFHLLHCLKKEGKLFITEELKTRWMSCIDPLLKEKVATISPLSYRDGAILEHDMQNCAASLALCKKVGVTEEEFWRHFVSFQKPPHRIEFVRTLAGVRYINDSKATSFDAVLKAIDALAAKENIILIAGGQHKGGDYRGWVHALQGKVKKILLIGAAAALMREQLRGTIPVEVVETLPNAVKMASQIAVDGDCVLLSPGCSSYDQFRDFEHRGDVFKELIKHLGEKL